MATRSKHGLDDACILVGDCHRGTVEAAPLPKLVDPLVDQSGWDSTSRPRRRELASVALPLFLQLRDARPRFRDLDHKRLDHSR